MENKFKLRISSLFRSSLGSCRSKKINDVIDQKPDFLPQTRQHHQLIDLFSPKHPPFLSICKPKWPINPQMQPAYTPEKSLFSRNKISDSEPLLVPAETHIPKTPLQEPKIKPKQKTQIKATAKKARCSLKLKKNGCSNYNGLCISDEEDEKDDDRTMFSASRSLSSDSSRSVRQNKGFDNYRPSGKARGRRVAKQGVMRLQGSVNGSFAMVKSSSDPYNDFKASMVEMIVEKKIVGAKDLENMLRCFLSLNSYHHHRVIIQVFTEIWEDLFSNLLITF